jgi:hypothetical protein
MPGQPQEPPATIFPSDGKSPAEANGAELLESVCPGQVEVGEKIGCRGGCPYFTGYGEFGDSGEWSLNRITRGHFLSPASEDAVLFMTGCEFHPDNFGGTILLTRGFQGWAVKWYEAGVETSQCHKIPLQDRREILVCIGADGGQGSSIAELYVEDLVNPTGSLRASGSPFFRTYDNSVRCGDDPGDPEVTRAFIEKVEFSGSAISVTASFGRSAPGNAEACSPTVKSYPLDFVFDGHTYQPTAASAEAARIFSH